MNKLKQPVILTTQQCTYRYCVELASNQLDHEGVPESVQILDVVVLEPTEEAIKSVIAAVDWLSSYTIVSYWVPQDNDEF
ncbi:hypothetical protein [Chroococcidiopsis sp. CCMEE 29]|uniref:hypothetical protein n=1 Tax=Chroococcidiopsis sp. CCMEE 29 TaxID=155894 RepID=UPI0020223AD1|nr:hypothetical protein [Chroococcidiopsis sp. CCMEE 29]